MSVEDDNSAGETLPVRDKKGEVQVALEVAGAQVLDGEELVQWMQLTDRVLMRPESLSALTKAAGDAMAPVIPPAVKAVALWAAVAVLVYNFMVRDLLILLFKLENTPPPAITPESMLQLFGGLFGF